MGALKDLADAISAAGPPAEGKRRYVMVGESAGRAIVADLVLTAARRAKGWRECLAAINRESIAPHLPAFVPTDDFPGFEIVDRVRVLKSPWL